MFAISTLDSTLADLFGILWQINLRATLIFGFAAIAAYLWPKSTAAIRHRIWALSFCFAGLAPVLGFVFPQIRIPMLTSNSSIVDAPNAVENSIYELERVDRVQPNSGPEVQVVENTTRSEREPIGNDLFDTKPEFIQGSDSHSLNPMTDLKPTSSKHLVVFGLAALFSIAWLIVSTVLLLRLVYGHWNAFRIVRAAQHVDGGPVWNLFQQLKSGFEIKGRVRLLESTRIDVPFTLGWIRPCVILPSGWSAWSMRQRKQVLLHELAHVKRADVSFQTIGSLVTSLLWFNPLVWFCLRQMRAERELATDNCVLAGGEKPSDYAKTLVDLLQLLRQRAPVIGASVAGSGNLKKRLAAILDPACPRHSMGRASSHIVLCSFVFLTFAISTISLVANQTNTGLQSENATLELSGTIKDENGKPLKNVSVYVFEKKDPESLQPFVVTDVGKSNENGEFNEEVSLSNSSSNRIVFFKSGMSIELARINEKPKQQFSICMVKDEPIEWDMEMRADMRLDKQSVKIRILSTEREPTKEALSKFRDSGSLVDFDGDVVDSIEQIPGVVIWDSSGKLFIHGTGTSKLRQLRTQPFKESSIVSRMLLSKKVSSTEDLGANQSHLRFATISFDYQTAITASTSPLNQVIAEKLIQYPEKTEFAFAFIKGGKVSYYGAVKKQGQIEQILNSESVFEIGSVSKVFTSDLFAKKVLSGKLKMDQKLQSVLRTSAPVGNSTLEQLASHSSGLPQMPKSFFDSGFDEANPYANFSTQELLLAIQDDTLIDPDKIRKFQYSNLGVSILGHVIAKTENKDYETVFQETIGRPLRMKSTTTDRNKIAEHLVKGFDSQGRECPPWDCNAIVPAGGLYSNVRDMAKYAVHCISPNNDTYRLQCQPILKRSKSVDQGLGWMLLNSKSGKVFSFHAGGTGGYSSFIAIEPKSQDGLIMLTNVEGGDNTIDTFALQLLAKLHRLNKLN